MEVPATEGADFDVTNWVEQNWNNALNTCVPYGELFVGKKCTDVGFADAAYDDENCTEGEFIPDNAIWTNWDDLN